MELFRPDGCLTDEGIHAIISGQLNELERLETAEHLAYCDKCLDRYTALLTQDALKPPPRSVRSAVMGRVRIMQNTWGRSAVAAVAAVLALTMWRSNALQSLMLSDDSLKTLLTSSQVLQASNNEEADVQTGPERLGKPYEGNKARQFYYKLFGSRGQADTNAAATPDAADTQATNTTDQGDNLG